MSKTYSTRQNLTSCESVSRRNFVVSIGLFVLLAITLFSFPKVLSAQTGTSGQITGSVTDQNGGVVPNAAITVTQIATGAKRTVVTSDEGNYSLVNLSIGVYKVSVTKSGYKETSVSDVVVNVDNITRQDASKITRI